VAKNHSPYRGKGSPPLLQGGLHLSERGGLREENLPVGQGGSGRVRQGSVFLKETRLPGPGQPDEASWMSWTTVSFRRDRGRRHPAPPFTFLLLREFESEGDPGKIHGGSLRALKHPHDFRFLRCGSGSRKFQGIASYLLAENATRMKIKQRSISPRALELLESYSWPGNLKEFERVILRSAVLSEGTT